MQRNKVRRLFSALIIITIPVLVFIQRQNIFDWARLYNYQPPAQVVSLADNTQMNDKMRRLFYVYRPSIEEREQFNKSCREDEETIVLGCYIEGRSIHLLDVTDVRLSGIEEVTAAHEVLHAAYARLSVKDKKNVDAMTQSAFAQLIDTRIIETIELYRKKDPSVVPNELHSILGTEVRNLPNDLENYYKRYFKDRLKIVTYSEQYESAFTDRKNQIKAYDEQLLSLKVEIEKLQSELSNDEASLTSQRAILDTQRSSGDISGYNSGIVTYNRSVNSYNNKVNKLTGLVSNYNEIVPKYNEIAAEQKELVEAIDSRDTVPSRQ